MQIQEFTVLQIITSAFLFFLALYILFHLMEIILNAIFSDDGYPLEYVTKRTWEEYYNVRTMIGKNCWKLWRI